MAEAEAPKFEQWAVVDLLGHRRLAGKVTEQVVAGAGFIRVDVPLKDGSLVTKLVSPKSIYEISPCTEEVARACAATLFGIEPVKPVDWAKQLPAHDDERLDDDEPIDEDPLG